MPRVLAQILICSGLVIDVTPQMSVLKQDPSSVDKFALTTRVGDSRTALARVGARHSTGFEVRVQKDATLQMELHHEHASYCPINDESLAEQQRPHQNITVTPPLMVSSTVSPTFEQSPETVASQPSFVRSKTSETPLDAEEILLVTQQTRSTRMEFKGLTKLFMCNEVPSKSSVQFLMCRVIQFKGCVACRALPGERAEGVHNHRKPPKPGIVTRTDRKSAAEHSQSCKLHMISITNLTKRLQPIHHLGTAFFTRERVNENLSIMHRGRHRGPLRHRHLIQVHHREIQTFGGGYC